MNTLESKSKEGTNYIPYKDNFIVLNERNRDIWVSFVRPIEFENSKDCGSDITKKDHQKFNERKQSQDTERKDLLDHDPIVGVLFLTGKRTESPSNDEPAVDHNLTNVESDSPDKNDKDNDPISKDFAELNLE
ncbi:PREDICTED: uncharacterized protein LOC107355019 [Acropora digitifera]|uniref:uncharacterized protein LOC107355019 n=1 Tax=Acropora digitifera TaxID=70779 RepID=UPI00077A0AD6|nr:PREDICTED: uncharacterized protein LOC107355019 [Acropora digitifera]